jgi:L1 cell adhesion molecule like protein
VLTYSSELITLCLLWEDFHDAIREGDGERVMLIWKFLLLVFNAGNRINYRKEAIIMLIQYNFLFSKRKAFQLAYSRFVNTHGKIGCNVPCDLHMEHLNKQLQAVLRHLHSNISASSVSRASRSIGIVHRICQQFEEESHRNKSKKSGKHNVPSSKKDVNMMIECFLESPCVLSNIPQRCCPSFKYERSILEDYHKEKLLSKMVDIVGAHLSILTVTS